MEKKSILLTAFRGTSAELLAKGTESGSQYKVLYLPSSKVKDSELLIEALEQKNFDYVISLGQRPNIKDKVHIEVMAKKGGLSRETTFDCEKLKGSLAQNGLTVKLSNNAGTSFCNELYWNGLKYLEKNSLETKMVFVHVPFEKNISDVEGFGEKLMSGIEMLLSKISCTK